MNLTIRDLMTDQALFGNQYGGDSWSSWRALLAGFYGLDLDEQQAETFRTLTAREPLTQAADELWLVIGRRGGKSAAAALLAVFEAVFNDHRAKLAPGEIATVMVIAADRKQARAVMRYVRGLLAHPMLARFVMRDQTESIELSNRCAIEVMTASHRSTRGYTAACVICDEIAFWHSEGANPDADILNAVRPSLATLGGKMIALSSPYARRGVLWSAYKRHYGKGSERVLVAQAPTLLMNPELPAHVVEEAYADDPIAAAAEYGAEFRSDVESFVSIEAVEACTRPGQVELPPAESVTYTAFVDPSGGVADSFTLAIGHRDGNTAVIDCARAIKPPFSPESVVVEYCALLKSYRVSRVTGDAYAGEWPREQFRKNGIQYDKSSRNRSELYRDLLPLLNSEQVELPPLPAISQQLVGLERRTSRGGRDSIDHAPGGHDDLANAVAGCAVHIGTRNTYDLSAWTDGF
ncbi:hypothetical protein [Halopseudomonas pelagia]|uniref:hypothetical protein n=1 Tax=Halopseudomonas pelagia TaxID=553151 RepID=UPI0003A75826|nr:hypothetical protein [Halopseudomonas pelagia]